ncbi:MAG: squalene/phytoene synthase family protein [Rhizobiales bacterium]|nr:squalene/phytoene synthase family protein [Hyphomicrobiales bacterium]
MSGADTSAQIYCANEARNRDFTGYASGVFAPQSARRAWLALTAFNAEVSQIRDHVSQPLPGEIRLQWWRDLLTGEGAGYDGAQANPVAAELRHAITAYNLPVEKLVRLIDAHVFDVYDDPMPDMAALEAHCRDTAGAMYELRAKILGAESNDVSRLAEHAGVAEGLVHTMIALPRHSARRQLYLPGDLMAMHSLNSEEIFLRQPSEALKATLAHLRGEARRQLDQAMAKLVEVPKQARVAFLPLAMVKTNLDRLERADPFAQPIQSRLRILWTLWRAASAKPFRN